MSIFCVLNSDLGMFKVDLNYMMLLRGGKKYFNLKKKNTGFFYFLQLRNTLYKSCFYIPAFGETNQIINLDKVTLTHT